MTSAPGGKGKSVGNEHQAAHVVHTGDLVLLKCQLNELDRYAEAGESPNDTGWLNADGLRGHSSITVAETLHNSSLDVREFLFVVVEQLNYIAQKDLARLRKHLTRQPGAPTNSQLAQLKTLEERAQHEADQNMERRQSCVRPVAYGEVIQLQHLRTKQFLRICTKKQANLQKTSRMVDLHIGSASSWLRANPFFKHKSQGSPITFGEQILLESVKLGNHWNLNWARCKNIAKEQVYEVNCSKPGRGFYIELYSRSVAQDSKVLSCPSPLRLLHPHHEGLVSASSAMQKSEPYLRRPEPGVRAANAKDIWVIEPGLANHGDSGIEWDITPVLFRHFGSGRYLAVRAQDVEALGGENAPPLTEVRLPQSPRSPRSPKGGRPGGRNRWHSNPGGGGSKAFAGSPLSGGVAGGGGQTPPPPSSIGCELVDQPGVASWFYLESCDILEPQSSLSLVPRGCHSMIRWEEPVNRMPFWLSCQGQPKGKRRSFALEWTSTRYTRDAIRFDVLDDPIDVMDDSDFINECDVVAEHTKLLRSVLTPRCADFNDSNVAALICAQCEHALSDMIFFLTDSRHWRSRQRGDRQFIEPDPLHEAWIAKPERQSLALELKYIDATFELFHEFVAHVPTLMEGDTHWGRRAVELNLNMHLRPSNAGQVTKGNGWDHVMGNMVSCMKTRCLKLMVRLWMCCFINSRKIENYFFKNGWVDTINTLNGHGLGASDVFVALMSNNAQLARQVDKGTLMKFIDFIRVLGPLDTWMSFLTAVCAPSEVAVGAMQQVVLSALIFAGHRASSQDRSATDRNRQDLLITPRILEGAFLPHSLGEALPGAPPPPLDQCMGQMLLVEGMTDIALSWTHPSQWIVGRGVLYHGPYALSLAPVHMEGSDDNRVWVSMVDLVWVLQPRRCCPLVKGKRYEDLVRERGDMGEMDIADVFRTLETTTAASGQFDRLKTLARYFLAQLQLISDLVKERQMNCIMALQEEYPFNLCVCGISDFRLPTSIRAAFCDILTDVWVDRYPHVQMVVPALMRNVEAYEDDLDQLPIFSLKNPEPPDAWSLAHQERLPKDLLAFYRMSTPYKMEAVVRAVRKYFSAGYEVEQQVHSETDDNVLLFAMLRTLSKLLRFGFIHNVALLKDLLGPLLRCLDGRTDLLSPLDLDDDRGGPESSDGPSSPGRDGNGDINLDLSEPMTPLLQASRNEPGAGAGRRDPSKLPRIRFPPPEDGTQRFEDSDENRKVNECKVKMLEVVMHVVQFGVHTKISHLVHIFHSMVLNSDYVQSAIALGSGAVLPPGVVERFSRALDSPTIVLNAPGVRDPLAMYVDLMMYRHPRVFALALSLLFSECCPTEGLMDLLDKVELMTRPQLETFDNIKNDIATLGKLVYSFENWGVDDQYSEVDNSKFMQVQRICLKLRSLALVGDNSSTALEIQKMMHETEFFSHFHYMIQLDPSDHVETSRPLLAKVTGLVCSCARSFVAANPKNQRLLAGVLDHGLWLLDSQPDMALLAVEIFGENRELCQSLPPKLVDKFADLIVRDRRERKTGPWYLLFFKAIVVAENVAIVRNQNMVIEAMKRKKPSAVLHLLQGEAGLERVVRLADNFSSMGQLRDPEASRWVGGDDGELIYYIISVEVLIGVAHGHGSQALVNRPFVSMLFPPTSLMRLLLRTSDAIGETPREPTFVSIHLRLKTMWMKLVRLLLYDLEKNMVDIDLLSSPLHVEFFEQVLVWVERALKPPKADLKTAKAAADDTPLLSEDEEEHVVALLHCIDDFFKNLFDEVACFEVCHTLVEVAERYEAFFVEILTTTSGIVGPACGLRDVSLLRITAHRVVSVVSPSQAAMFERHVPPKQLWSRFGRTGTKRRSNEFSSEMEAQYHTMLEALAQNPEVQARTETEEARIGQVITRIAEMTDPEHALYHKALPRRAQDSLPEGLDFRRCLITTQSILERFVLHAQDNLESDLPSMRLIQRALLSILQGARRRGEVALLIRLQQQFVEAGVTNLIIRMLHLRVAEDITEKAWTLLAEMLCSGVHDGEQWTGIEDESVSLVSKAMQQGILDVCVHGDDSGMWESLQEVFGGVGIRIKYSHALRRLPSLTEEETVLSANYEKSLAFGIRVMEAVRLMVEGHYFPMQQYLYSQVGNSRSCNVPETTASLLMKMCKDPSAPDNMDHSEVLFLKHVLLLLSELAQGPNLRNQELLSTMGVVETCIALCAASFERTSRATGDLYPSPIRLLKAGLIELVLSMLEGRQDTRIHKNVLQRVDPQIIRERLEFVHLYFVFGSLETKGLDETTAAVPLGSQAELLVTPTAHPSAVFAELKYASALAEEFLEDLNDAELDELFSEGLSMLELVYQLAPHSPKFKTEVYPDEGELALEPPRRADFHGSDREYEEEKLAFHRRSNYRMAFDFLSRFVKTIEVVLNGHLQPLHFQQPLTAMWYVQEASKQLILDTIPFSSPDIKAKAFIQMCGQAHTESELIRDLSRFSIAPGPCLALARRHLYDGMHRPFQSFLANDAKLMQQLLQVALLFGLLLGLHVGSFLVPGDLGDASADVEGEELVAVESSRWSSPLTEKIAYSMGAVYFVCTFLWIFVTVCIKVPLHIISSQRQDRERAHSSTALLLNAIQSLLEDPFFMWRFALLTFCTVALFQRHFWIFSFLLLDFFCQNSLLATVLLAIKGPFGSLVMTFLGAAIVTNSYAAIGFHWFREEFGDYCNDNILTCTQNILYQGTRNGIVGLSSMMKLAMPGRQDWPERMAFDMSYFIVFGIMILNTIVGLIVDSFGALRLEQEARKMNQSTQTFISSLDRKRIDAIAQAAGISNGFEYHEQYRQNKWDYMAFIFYLREKRLHDYTGPEQAIRTLVEAGDYKWMPIGRSRMDEGGEDESMAVDDQMQRIERRVNRAAQEISSADNWRSVARGVSDLAVSLRKKMDCMQEEIEQLQNVTTEHIASRSARPAVGQGGVGGVHAGRGGSASRLQSMNSGIIDS